MVTGQLLRLAHTSRGIVKQRLRALLGSAPETPGPAPAYWRLEADASGTLSLQGRALHELRKQFGSPLQIVNAERLRDNAGSFLAAARSGGRCEIFYSYKTNPVPGVLSELHALGIGAEVISHYELWLARRLGVPADKIIYNGPAKSEASLREAILGDIRLLNINHREELAQVARIARELGRRPRVGLRVTVGGGWSGQFGTPVAGGLALRAYEQALALDAFDVVGLHAHRGGSIHGEAEAMAFVAAVLQFADDLRRNSGVRLELLNLGGSLATPSVRGLSPAELRLNRSFSRPLKPADPSQSLGIERYISLVLGRVDDHYRRYGETPPVVIFEPGRALTGDAQMLLSTVQSTKADDERTYAILDAGINVAESCRSEYHRVFRANGWSRSPLRCYALAGPICTPGDTLYWAVHLPELEPGDSLLIMDAGAYFVPFSTAFSFPRPAVVMVDRDSVRTLRRAERFEDLVALDATEHGGTPFA